MQIALSSGRPGAYYFQGPCDVKLRRRLREAFDAIRGTSANAFSVNSAVKWFARERLRDVLGVGRDVPVTLEMPVAGENSLIWFARAGEHACVVRAFPPERAEEAARHIRASELLQQHGVNAPHIRQVHEASGQHPITLLVEEFIAGKARDWGEFSQEDIAAVARELARLHSIENARWGKFGQENSGDYFADEMNGIRDKLRTAVRASICRADDAARVEQWFASWQSKFRECRTFSLIHNDVHRNNGLFAPDGRYYLVDFSRFYWGFAAKDLARNYLKVCNSDSGNIAAFDAAYLEAASAELAARVREFLPFFNALNRLSVAAIRSKRADRIEEESETGASDAKTERRAEWNRVMRGKAWSELQEFISGHSET